MIELARIDLPRFGVEAHLPALDVQEHVARLDVTVERMAARGLVHLDEWVHSPFRAGSDIVLRSGTALQMDIIPVSAGPFCYVNAEDGIALADEALRAEIVSRFPGMWTRIQARRAFMNEVLGIRIDDSVLPLSNTAGWLAPYALAPSRAFARTRNDEEAT